MNISNLTQRNDIYLVNNNVYAAYYVNSRFVQCFFADVIYPYSTDAEIVAPAFNGCYLTQCAFDLLSPAGAEFEFHGENSVVQTSFRSTQKVVLCGPKFFVSGSSELHISFGGDDADHEIVAEDSYLDFSHLTSEEVNAVNVTLYATNCTIKLPNVALYGKWRIIASNCRIDMPNSFATSLSASNCIIQAVDELNIGKAEGCTLYFSGSEASQIVLGRAGYGLIYIGNEIRNGTPEENMENKTGVTFAAEVCIGNRLNMAGTTMAKGGTCYVCLGNYNGRGTVLTAASDDELTREAVSEESDK